MPVDFRFKKVVITGGLGMIGSNLAHALVALGVKVVLVDNEAALYGANRFNIRGIENSVDVYCADIREKEGLAEIIKDADVLFNFAGQVSHNDSLDDPYTDVDINYVGHLNILETTRKVNPQMAIVHAGSRLQYGKIDSIPVSEEHALHPLTPYALNKTAAENMYQYYSRRFGIPVILCRIANPYGPRGQMKHSKYCLINWFLRQAMEGKTITVYGDGTQLRDYIYIDDLVEMFIRLAECEKAYGEVFNLGSGIGTSFCEMVETITSVVGAGGYTNVDWPDDYVNVDTGDFVADISKVIECIGWKPQTSLEDGIRKTYEFYKEHKKHYC